MDFVAELEARIGRTLETIDIGGGLSTTYKDDKEPEGFEYAKYKQELQDLVPELFTGKYRIITEFGRSLALKAGKTLSRIDYIKQWVPEVKPIILNHVGSNQFVRECYVPAQWSHRFSVATKEGKVKEGGEKVIYDLGGPMCFQVCF